MNEADRCIKFCESLKLSKGKWRGKKLKLLQWQIDFIRALFAVDPTTSRRRYTRAMLFIPRKQGKSTLLAALSLYFLCCSETQAQVVCCASTRKQAGFVFDEALYMVQKSPTLKKKLTYLVGKKIIKFPAKNNALMVISADVNGSLGDNVSHLIADEIAAWRDGRLWSAMVTSQAAREDRLAVALTTAGTYDPEHFAYKMYLDAKEVLKNPDRDPRFLPVIYEFPAGADYTQESTWQIASPSYGQTVQKEYFDEWMTRIKNTPSDLYEFLRFHGNVWVSPHLDNWLPADKWQSCGANPVDPSEIKGKWYGGLDLSAVSDATTLVLAAKQGDDYKVTTHAWIPEESAKRRQARDQVMYLNWHRLSKLELTPGDVIDYDTIVRRVLEIHQTQPIHTLAVDAQFQGLHCIEMLKRAGINVVEYGQGYRSMGLPVRRIEELVMAGRLHHGNHPLLNWQINNVVLAMDPAGNRKFDKDKSREKIDAVVSLAMAIGVAEANTNTGVVLNIPLRINLQR